MKHFPALDGLRGLAALMVLMFHSNYFNRVSSVDEVFYRLVNGFSAGVDIFFVLSGFLITSTLILTRHEENYFFNFYVKRILRIFPLYYLIIAVCLIAPMLFPFVQQNDLRLLEYWGLNYWLFLSNVWSFGPHPVLGVSWSLAYEEQFYLFWPFIVLIAGTRWLSLVCVGFIALGLFARTLVSFEVTDSIFWSLCARFDLLALGALLAVWYSSERHKQRRKAAIFGACLFVFGASCLAAILWVMQGFWGPWMKSIGILAVGCLSAFVIVRVVSREEAGAFYWFLRTPFMRSFGKYSFAIYLVHSPIDACLRRVIDLSQFIFPIFGTEIPMMVVYWFILGGVSWGVSWLSWHFFEIHFMNLRPRLLRVPQREMSPS